MNSFRYSMFFVVCAMTLLFSGCAQHRVSVVNTSSAVVIHASDYEMPKAQNNKITQSGAPSAKSTGNVIHLGDGYEKIDLPKSSRL